MRAWMETVGDEDVALVHGVSGQDLDTLIQYAKEKSEQHTSGGDMKHVARVEQTVIIDWCNKRGVTWAQFMRDESLQTAFLDDPANAPFRIWKGRI